MKKHLFLLIALLSINSLFSQKNDWNNYKLDSIVSINLPGETYELDTVLQSKKLHMLYSNLENSKFVSMNILYESKNINKNLSELPSDINSLNKFYIGVVKGMAEKIKDKLYLKEFITRNGFKGYRLLYKDSHGSSTYKTDIFLLNNYLYTFTYANLIDFDDVESELFFNSISINKKQKITQFGETSKAEKMGYAYGKIASYVILITIGLVVYLNSRKKNKLKN